MKFTLTQEELMKMEQIEKRCKKGGEIAKPGGGNRRYLTLPL